MNLRQIQRRPRHVLSGWGAAPLVPQRQCRPSTRAHPSTVGIGVERGAGVAGGYVVRWKYDSRDTMSNRETLPPRHIAAPDLLDRDFTAPAPNQKWVADLTRIPTGEGVLWLASVRDAFSNKVVGWRTGPRADVGLALSALGYALFSRDGRGGELIFVASRAVNIPRYGSRSGSSMRASPRSTLASGTVSIMRSRRICGRR